MASGNRRLFGPSDSLNPPDPTTSKQEIGNIINPPNYAQLGGLDGPGRFNRNRMTIVRPGASTRKVPVA